MGVLNMERGKGTTWGKGHLHTAVAFDGEAKGARQGLEVAMRMAGTTHITCYIDNQAVIQGLANIAPKSSQRDFLRYQELAEQSKGRVQIRWSPGHINQRE